MSKRSIGKRAETLINELGRGTAHYLFPNDIDFYFVALELVNSKGKTVQYMAFPIMPDSIIFQDTEITKVQRTFGGITTLRTSTFDPKSYTLQGNFGRNFKILVGGQLFEFSAFNFDFGDQAIDSSKFKITVPELSVSIKNGYGCIKLLEKIIKRADQLDQNGEPYKLFLYNTSLNHQFLVEPIDFTFSQSVSMNMIWKYSLRLNAIAKVEDLTDNSKLGILNSLTINGLNSVANKLGSKIAKSLL